MAKAKFDSVVAIRKLSLVLMSLLYLCTSVQAEINPTVCVNRRIKSDLFNFISCSKDYSVCHSPDRTYLISEKRCVSDEEILSGM